MSSENLNKPAITLLRHNLTGILETAVRSSNAQYDDPEILNRLDVRILEVLFCNYFTLFCSSLPIHISLSYKYIDSK